MPAAKKRLQVPLAGTYEQYKAAVSQSQQNSPRNSLAGGHGHGMQQADNEGMGQQMEDLSVQPTEVKPMYPRRAGTKKKEGQ